MYPGSVLTSFFASLFITSSSVSGTACRYWLESRLIRNVARGESRVQYSVRIRQNTRKGAGGPGHRRLNSRLVGESHQPAVALFHRLGV